MLMGEGLQLGGGFEACFVESRCALDRLLTTLTPRDRQSSPACKENIKLDIFGCHGCKMPISDDSPKPGIDDPSGVPFDILYQQCLKLPPELCGMIMKMIFEDVFGPRKVLPHQEPQRDQAAGKIFLALDKDMYRRNFELYWSTNTWVIRDGPVSKTMRFMSKGFPISRVEYSRQEPCPAALNIQSMELCFSYKDAIDPADWNGLTNLEQGVPDVKDFLDRIDSEETRDFLEKHGELFKSVALKQWQDKFDRVAVGNIFKAKNS